MELRLKPQLKANLPRWSVPIGRSKDKEEGEDCAAAQQTHRFVRGVAGATPQGARCVELRQKPQLEAAARSELAAPVSAHQQLPSDWSRAALPVVEVVPLASQARSAHSA